MTKLTWSEQEAVESLVGGLASVAGLIAYRPGVADRVLAAVVDLVDDGEKALIGRLAGRSALAVVARDVVGVTDPDIVHDDERIRFGAVRSALEGMGKR